MDDTQISDIPVGYARLQAKCKEIGFDMPSDLQMGSLLKTLIASKIGGNFLELGTGIGLSLAWMIEGMDAGARITSLDNNPQLTDIAKEFFGEDDRVELICEDGSAWIHAYRGASFDLVFADAWPGKYSELLETLRLVKLGGLYVVDDMTPRSSWPEGHHEKAEKLIQDLEAREDFTLTQMSWSSGVIIAVRTQE